MRHSLVEQLRRILEQPDRLYVNLPGWQARLTEHLVNLSNEEAKQLLEEVRALLKANRTLFEKESLTILETLVQQPGAARSKVKAGRYKNIRDL